jgi:hypothetical protein
MELPITVPHRHHLSCINQCSTAADKTPINQHNSNSSFCWRLRSPSDCVHKQTPAADASHIAASRIVVWSLNDLQKSATIGWRFVHGIGYEGELTSVWEGVDDRVKRRRWRQKP